MNLICIKCKEKKEISLFVKDSGKKLGYRKICKDCRKIYLKKWSGENKEKIRETNKRYCENNPDVRRETSKNYYNKIKSDEKAVSKRHECSRRWSKTKKGKLLRRIAENKRRKFSKETDDGSINYESIQKLLKKQNYKSAISGKDITNEFHIDHIIPLCEGGENIISNIQLLTPKENLKKGRKCHLN